MNTKNTQEPVAPAAFSNDSLPSATPGNIYKVNTLSNWRGERSWCLYHRYIEPHESLIYHFSDGSEWCFYNYTRKKSIGTETITRRVPPGYNPHRWGWQQDLGCWRVEPAPDALVCESIKAMCRQNTEIHLVGWSISNYIEAPVPTFIQKKDAGSHYLTGDIALSFMRGGVTSDHVIGTLDEAVIAINYLKNIANISYAVALARLNEKDQEFYEDTTSQGFDVEPYHTSDSLRGSAIVKEAAKLVGKLPRLKRPGEDENGMTAQDYIDEFMHAHCLPNDYDDEL